MHIDKLSVRTKFGVILTLFFVGFLYFSALELTQRYQVLRDVDELATLTDAALVAGDLIHEIQKERGMSNVFLSSSGREMAVELNRQRRDTDEDLATLRRVLGNVPTGALTVQAQTAWDDAVAHFDGLGNLRRAIGEQNITAQSALRYYTRAVQGLLDASALLAGAGSFGQISRLTHMFVNLSQARERAGLERALLGGVFASGHLGHEDFTRLVSLLAEQRSFTDVALLGADDTLRDSYGSAMRHSELQELERLRSSILARGGIDGLAVDPGHWFALATTRIDLLKGIADEVASALTAASERIRAEAFGKMSMALAATLVGLVITIIASYLTVRSILGRIAILERTIGHIEREADLTVRVDLASEDEIGRAGRAFDRMLERFSGLIRHLATSSTQLSSAAEELSAVTDQSRRELLGQRQETEQVAAAMNEMTTTVQDIGRSTAHAAQAAQQADAAGNASRTVVNEARTAMESLAAEVRRAADVITRQQAESRNVERVLVVIRDIAEQTNLLALNAAIEAARAGDLGRGFAVVADEVRTLAARTEQSTDEVQGIVETLQQGASQAVAVMGGALDKAAAATERVERAAEALEAIVADLTTIRDMSDQVAAATEQQGIVAESVNRNVNNIAVATEREAEAAEQVAAASQHIARLATELDGLVAQFRTEAEPSPRPRARTTARHVLVDAGAPQPVPA